MGYNKDLFEGVPDKKVNKSRFNLSHEYKSQFLMGQLYPILVIETMPMDNFKLDAEFMFRFSPMYFPIMHHVTMRADWFYFPIRILWPYMGEENRGWKKWISEQWEADVPTVNANMAWQSSQLPNHVLGYMGIPICNADLVTGEDAVITGLNAFPLSGYLAIWDEYYRVPQLEEEKWFPLESGDNTSLFTNAFDIVGTVYPVLRSYWQKDYFTSALPYPQIDDAVLIPLISDDPEISGPRRWYKVSDDSPASDGGLGTNAGETQVDATENVWLDIQETAGSIRQLRYAEVLQSYYERLVKVGQRYRDWSKGLHGVDPEPAAVDVPVLIGSKFGRVQIADVMTQADTMTDTTGQKTGDYRGQANMYSNDGGWMEYFCKEYGFIMCIMQVNPNTSYGQGIERFWRRDVQADYPLDMFASVGDQEIKKEELLYPFKTVDSAKGQETFGYIPRFSEMRYKNNIHTMQMNWLFGKSQHLGRIWDPEITTGAVYNANVEINSDFVQTGSRNSIAIQGDIRLSDTFRVLPSGTYVRQPSEAIIYGHIYHTVIVDRALPMYSTPKLT